MRELYMKTGQGFLLVFSITSASSLDELQELREQIIRIKDDEHVPIVIVGNKSDLEGDRKVARSKAFALSQGWGNAPYYETSARRRGMCCFCLTLLPCFGIWGEGCWWDEKGEGDKLTEYSECGRSIHRPLPTDHPQR